MWRALFFIHVVFFLSRAYAEEIPREFSLKVKATPKETVISLESLQDRPFGQVRKAEVGGYTYFYYSDSANQVIATGKMETADSDSPLEIFDAGHHLMGTILRENHFFAPPTYSIYDGAHTLIATATMNMIGSRFIFTDPSNSHQSFVTFHRPYFRLIGDHWYAQTHDLEKLDVKMVVMIGAFQADLDTKNSSLLGSR